MVSNATTGLCCGNANANCSHKLSCITVLKIYSGHKYEVGNCTGFEIIEVLLIPGV